MKTYHSGIDVFSSDPDKAPKEDIVCLACGTKLTGEKRLRHGSYVSALANIKSWAYDYFCPHAGEEGHDRLVALIQERDDLTSKKLREIIEVEIAEERARFLSEHVSL